MPRTVTDNDEIHDLAIEALKSMLAKRGPNHKFPPDAIWELIPADIEIPSTKKPHQPKRLMKEGYIQDTGAKTRAQSGPRAGSPTTEYRFGQLLVPSHAVPSTFTRSPFPTTLGEQPRLFRAAGTGSVKPDAPTISHSECIRGIQEAMEAEGYLISPAELANFLLALTVSPLVILSGISGTGKSLLPRKFSKLTNSQFTAIPVQPQWADNSDLFGYVPSLARDTFVKGRMVDAVLEAKRTPERLYIVLLDEMNLAPVEHYFSDFLSIIESRERKGERVGTDRLPIDLPSRPKDGDPYASLRDVELPPNLRVIGTANMDETTHSFSPKVLDRAFTIEFDDPDLTAFATSSTSTGVRFASLAHAAIAPSNPVNVMEADSKSRDLFEVVAGWLDEIQGILAPAGIKFGYRTRDAILLYLHFWREFGLADVLSGCAALDFCLLQKVLPKISGSGEAMGSALKKLSDWLEARSVPEEGASGIAVEFVGPLERSREKVSRMLDLLDLDGSTRYWGV